MTNGDGAIRSYFLSLKRQRQFGTISSSEIDTILYELVLDELITQEVQKPTGNTVYKISVNGIEFINGLKEFERRCQNYKLFIFNAHVGETRS